MQVAALLKFHENPRARLRKSSARTRPRADGFTLRSKERSALDNDLSEPLRAPQPVTGPVAPYQVQRTDSRPANQSAISSAVSWSV